jgi:hypothetical protein
MKFPFIHKEGFHLIGVDSEDTVKAYDGPHSRESGAKVAWTLFKQMKLVDPELTYKIIHINTSVIVK